MVATQDYPVPKMATLTVTWEKLPDDFQLEEQPVENTGQPLMTGALREILELMGYIKSEMLIASKRGLCAMVNSELVIKAYVASSKLLCINMCTTYTWVFGQWSVAFASLTTDHVKKAIR